MTEFTNDETYNIYRRRTDKYIMEKILLPKIRHYDENEIYICLKDEFYNKLNCL